MHDEFHSHDLMVQLGHALERYSTFNPKPGLDPEKRLEDEIGHLPTSVMLDFYHKFNDKYGHLRPHF